MVDTKRQPIENDRVNCHFTSPAGLDPGLISQEPLLRDPDFHSRLRQPIRNDAQKGCFLLIFASLGEHEALGVGNLIDV